MQLYQITYSGKGQGFSFRGAEILPAEPTHLAGGSSKAGEAIPHCSLQTPASVTAVALMRSTDKTLLALTPAPTAISQRGYLSALLKHTAESEGDRGGLG